MVVFWDPGSVPDNWRAVLSEERLEAGSSSISSDYAGPETLDSTLPFSDRLDGGRPAAYCDRCQNGKPPRCHHCSVCKPSFLLLWLVIFFYHI